MLSISRMRILFGSLAVLVALLFSAGTSTGQGAKANKKNVVIQTFDGVDLEGTLYPNPGGKRDATVILLHDFDLKKGGSSQTQGWNDLAAALQADGYVVLSFDFRGFGGSTNVNANTFWAKPHNMPAKKGAGKPSTIAAKNFPKSYVPVLLNDIAAAKAYLDRQNDSRDCNTSSTILIGAGNGAALGSLWMGHETRRRRNKNVQAGGVGIGLVRPVLGDLESKDLAAAMWLSINTSQVPPSLASKIVPSLQSASRVNKIPVAFVFGRLDASSGQTSRNYVERINGGAKTKSAIEKEIGGTKLAGDKLIDNGLDTEKYILSALSSLMEKRGVRERIDRKSTMSEYYYVLPTKNDVPKRRQKIAGEEVGPVDLNEIP